MTIIDHIYYWLDSAAHDWDTVEALQAASPRATLVFAHWTLEKLSKALWVRDNSAAVPPATDNVAELLAATIVKLGPTQVNFVGRLKAFHDDTVESDPERPTPRFHANETPHMMIAQADIMRQQLLALFPREGS